MIKRSAAPCKTALPLLCGCLGFHLVMLVNQLFYLGVGVIFTLLLYLFSVNILRYSLKNRFGACLHKAVKFPRASSDKCARDKQKVADLFTAECDLNTHQLEKTFVPASLKLVMVHLTSSTL